MTYDPHNIHALDAIYGATSTDDERAAALRWMAYRRRLRKFRTLSAVKRSQAVELAQVCADKAREVVRTTLSAAYTLALWMVIIAGLVVAIAA